MSEPSDNESDLVFDHLGIIVPEIDAGRADLSRMLGSIRWTQRFDDPTLGVSVQFACDRSGVVYELIAPLNDSSPVARALQSRTNLLNQVAYRTTVLEVAVKRLRAAGATPISKPIPALAFGGARVQFLMMPLGFVVELIEIDRAAHIFS